MSFSSFLFDEAFNFPQHETMNTILNKRLVGTLVLLLIGTGCASFSSLHTARTTPEKKLNITASGGAFYFPTLTALLTAIGKTNPVIPFGEILVRKGVSKKVDVGLKYTFPLQTVADVK